MDYRLMSEEQKQRLVAKAVQGAIMTATYNDNVCTHFTAKFPGGLMIKYIANKKSKTISIDMEATVIANGYVSLAHYLADKPNMINPILDGINEGKIVKI